MTMRYDIKSMKSTNCHRAENNHKQFKQIAQPSKHNHFESTKNTHEVHYSIPKQFIT